MKTPSEIAPILAAITWPLTVLIILLAYRKKIPVLMDGLVSRTSKLEFAGISLELAKAKPFMPEWASAATGIDLRHKATSVQINDSTARTFITQLMDDQRADYAEINLGSGQEWLTSRLYVIAILYQRMKNINCFVFIETAEGTRKRYVGWAYASQIRWSLARKYPWLEQAFAQSYAAHIGLAHNVIASNQGKLGYQYAPQDAQSSIDLLRGFIEKIQNTTISQPNTETEWVQISTAPSPLTYEHAQWITSELVESLLGVDCHTETVPALGAKNDQLASLLTLPKRFVAVTSTQGRLEYLIDRSVLLEQVAGRVASQLDSSTKTD